MAETGTSWRGSQDEDESDESFVINSDSADDASLADSTETGDNEQEKILDHTNDGRLTPMIRKAIRRSIHQFAKDTSDEDENIHDNSAKIIIPDSEEDSDDDANFVVASKSIRKRVVRLDSSEEDPAENIPQATSKEASFVVAPDTDDSVTIEQDESERTRQPRGRASVESLDDTGGTPEDQIGVDLTVDNPIGEELAMSIAIVESRNTSLDPVAAQKQAYLVHQRQQVERKLAKTKLLYNSGKMELLPDRGEKLRLSIMKDEKELESIIKDLENLNSEATSGGPVKKEVPKPSLFKEGSLDIDPTYLQPTTSHVPRDLGKKALETHERELGMTVERLKDLHGSLLAKPTEDQKAKDPRGLKVPLMPHQKYALTWLLWRETQNPAGGVLADDMGLGKTLTMISLILASKEARESGDTSDDEEEKWLSSARTQRHKGETLVVAPASLVAQWEAEVQNRCKRGLLTVELYHGNNRESNPKRLARNDMVITTYNILSREFKNSGVLCKIHWRRVILDEAHVIRNHKSQTCESVCGLSASKRWVLTGTPVHNKEMDLFAMLKFLRCSPFDDVRVWKRWVDNKNAAGHERLATVMKSIMLRRTKQELQADGGLESLPEKTVETIEVTLDPEERLVYDKVMVYSRTLFAQFLAQRAEKAHTFELGAGMYDKPSWMTTYKDTQFTKAQKKLLSMHADVATHEILVLLLRLRQACCHPSLINSMLDREELEQNGLENADDPGRLITRLNDMSVNEDDGEIGVDHRVTERLLTSENPVFDPSRRSSKMRAVLEKIEEVTAAGDKVIVVSQWVSVLEIVAGELGAIKGVTYSMFTGKVPVKDRQNIMDDFNSPRSKRNVLLLSLTAGGVGLNLVGANHLLLVDIHWNPQLECQAQDRIYRFGQKKDVFIYRYICTDTIEERIKHLQDKKMEIADNLLSGGGKVAASKLSLDEIKSLFGM